MSYTKQDIRRRIALNELEGFHGHYDWTNRRRGGAHRAFYKDNGRTALFERDAQGRPVVLYANRLLTGALHTYRVVLDLLTLLAEVERQQKFYGSFANHYGAPHEHYMALRLSDAETLVRLAINDQRQYMNELEQYWLHETPFQCRNYGNLEIYRLKKEDYELINRAERAEKETS